MESITSPPMSQGTPGSFFSPLLISMLGIVVTSLAIIFYHFFLVKYCNRRRQNSDAVAQPAPVTGGVDQKLLQAIPISPFSVLKCQDFHLEQDECVVCLGELEDDDVVRLLPNCKHAFHVSCIDQWFASHTSCPLCRSPVIATSGDDENPPPSCSDSRAGGGATDRESDASGTSDNSSGTASSSLSSSGVQSFGLLRHCASMVLPAPAEGRSSRMINGLKRSLSMDQCFVAIDLQRESETANCSSDASSSSSSTSDGLTRGGSYRTRSMGHFDRVSSKLLRSFSRLRLGKANSATILPY